MDISYQYDSFTVKNLKPWQWALGIGMGPMGITYALLDNGTVKHTNKFEEFQNEMVEYCSFIVKVSKETRGLNLFITSSGLQLHIDYAWKNSHEFKSCDAHHYIYILN